MPAYQQVKHDRRLDIRALAMLRRIVNGRLTIWQSNNVREWAGRELKRIIEDWPMCEPCRPGTASLALRTIADGAGDNAAAVDEACYELMILEEVTKSGDTLEETH